MENPTPDGPLAPDAPIIHLLSLSHNKLLKDYSTEELAALLRQTKELAQQPQTLAAKLNREAGPKSNSLAAKKKAILDSI